MKKLIIVLLLTVAVPFSLKATTPEEQSCNIELIARGGYNFLENAPITSCAIVMQLWSIRTEMDIGWTQFTLPDNSKSNFCCISTMIGYSYITKHSFYALIGIANCGATKITTDESLPYTLESMMRGKVKVGCNLFVTKKLFFNIDLSYIWPPLKKHPEFYTTYTGLNLTAGLGVKI